VDYFLSSQQTTSRLGLVDGNTTVPVAYAHLYHSNFRSLFMASIAAYRQSQSSSRLCYGSFLDDIGSLIWRQYSDSLATKSRSGIWP